MSDAEHEPPANGPEDVGWSDMDRGRAPLVFRIPPGSPRRSCTSCAAIIYFVFTGNGRRMPVDPDGKSHFATCTSPEVHRRPRARAPRAAVIGAQQLLGAVMDQPTAECRTAEISEGRPIPPTTTAPGDGSPRVSAASARGLQGGARRP